MQTRLAGPTRTLIQYLLKNVLGGQCKLVSSYLSCSMLIALVTTGHTGLQICWLRLWRPLYRLSCPLGSLLARRSQLYSLASLYVLVLSHSLGRWGLHTLSHFQSLCGPCSGCMDHTQPSAFEPSSRLCGLRSSVSKQATSSAIASRQSGQALQVSPISSSSNVPARDRNTGCPV